MFHFDKTGNCFIFNNYDTFFRYSISTKTWTTLKTLPTSMSTYGVGLTAMGSDRNMYCLSTTNSNEASGTKIFKFNTSTNTFTLTSATVGDRAAYFDSFVGSYFTDKDSVYLIPNYSTIKKLSISTNTITSTSISLSINGNYPSGSAAGTVTKDFLYIVVRYSGLNQSFIWKFNVNSSTITRLNFSDFFNIPVNYGSVYLGAGLFYLHDDYILDVNSYSLYFIPFLSRSTMDGSAAFMLIRAYDYVNDYLYASSLSSNFVSGSWWIRQKFSIDWPSQKYELYDTTIDPTFIMSLGLKMYITFNANVQEYLPYYGATSEYTTISSGVRTQVTRKMRIKLSSYNVSGKVEVLP